MEATLSTQQNHTFSKSSLWAGRIISGLCILFQLFDAFVKIIKDPHAIEASAGLGLPVHTLPGIGITLLVCTIIYAIPRTAIIGALLLTAYLGGATAIMVRAGQPVYFSVIFGILVWVGLYLRNRKLHSLLF